MFRECDDGKPLIEIGVFAFGLHDEMKKDPSYRRDLAALLDTNLTEHRIHANLVAIHDWACIPL